MDVHFLKPSLFFLKKGEEKGNLGFGFLSRVLEFK